MAAPKFSLYESITQETNNNKFVRKFILKEEKRKKKKDVNISQKQILS